MHLYLYHYNNYLTSGSNLLLNGDMMTQKMIVETHPDHKLHGRL